MKDETTPEPITTTVLKKGDAYQFEAEEVGGKILSIKKTHPTTGEYYDESFLYNEETKTWDYVGNKGTSFMLFDTIYSLNEFKNEYVAKEGEPGTFVPKPDSTIYPENIETSIIIKNNSKEVSVIGSQKENGVEVYYVKVTYTKPGEIDFVVPEIPEQQQ